MTLSKTYNTDNLPEMRKFDNNFFDWAVVDPPYGINATKMSMGDSKKTKTNSKGEIINRNRLQRFNCGSGKLTNRILNKSLIDWDDAPPPSEYWKELFRISKNQIICGANYFPLPPSRGVIAWDKLQPWKNFSQFELIWTSTDKPAKVYRISSRGGANKIEKFHPTEKPIELYEKLYFDFIPKGSKIIDTHLGAGNNRIVADRWNCDFYGYETNKDYFDKQEERFYNYLKNKNSTQELKFEAKLQTLDL